VKLKRKRRVRVSARVCREIGKDDREISCQKLAAVGCEIRMILLLRIGRKPNGRGGDIEAW
jgi:hypothetical protein